MFLRKIKREAMRALVNELFVFNERDYCWDPVGSVDKYGLDKAIEVIARGKLPKDRKLMTKKEFSRK